MIVIVYEIICPFTDHDQFSYIVFNFLQVSVDKWLNQGEVRTFSSFS